MSDERLNSKGEGSRAKVSQKQLNKYNKVIHYGEVMRISDDGNMKLKVFLEGIDTPNADAFIDDENDPDGRYMVWCEPFLPRMFNVCPQVGEAVKIILHDTKNPTIQREWIGPIISQPERIKEDPFYWTALAGKRGGFQKLGRNYKSIREADGIYPNINDVSLLGKDNSDIQLKEREVLIRAGQHILDNPLKLNEVNPAYINLSVLKPSDLNEETNNNPTENELNLTENRTDTVIMSNKIFLIGRDSNSTVIKPILSKKDHLNLENNLHPVVYGDVLYEFMVIMRQWVKSHIHIGDRREPDPSGSTIKLEEWFVKNLDDRLLSRNVFVGGDVPVIPGEGKSKVDDKSFLDTLNEEADKIVDSFNERTDKIVDSVTNFVTTNSPF